MKLKIIKIDGEFAIVQNESGIKNVAPSDIFPKEIKVGSVINIEICRKKEEINNE